MNAPELNPVDELYFLAYIALDSCRPPSFSGAGLIPWDKILQYGQYMRLTGESLDEFIDIVTLVDALVMQRVAEESKDGS